ncbi:unnamed protein product [Sphagnum jensenii]|uniref:HMA domain-containing protein n=1 Tax=Sphagnum jensenii TaxID=128206 RepID=A0ABP1AK41_9BRYO
MSMGLNEVFCRQRQEPSWIPVDRIGSYRDRPVQGSPFSRSGRYLQYIELNVPMCCTKCQEKVREELLDMEGVHSVLCDQQSQRVTITASNYVDPLRVLRKVKRIKKKSEFWVENTLLHADAHEYAVGLNSTGPRSYNRFQRSQYTLPSSSRTFFDPYHNTMTSFDPYHTTYNLPPYAQSYYTQYHPYPSCYYY